MFLLMDKLEKIINLIIMMNLIYMNKKIKIQLEILMMNMNKYIDLMLLELLKKN